MGRRLRLLLLLLAGLVLFLAISMLTGLFGGILGSDHRAKGPGRPSGDGSGTVDGRVLSASGRGAPAGIQVVARGEKHTARTETDEAGRFRFRNVPEGTAEIEAAAGPLVGRGPITEGHAEIRLPGECVIGGRVVSELTSESIGLAVVRCAGRTVQADDRGAFRLEGIEVPDARPPLIEVAAPEFRPLKYTPPLDERWDDLFLRMKAR